jgi:cyanophycinase
MVLDRASAEDPGLAAVVRKARFIYLSDGSPLHLKSVLKGSATFEALRDAWAGGAVVAGSGAGAMVLTDPMVDPRGGALTVGLGLVEQLAVVPQFGNAQKDGHSQKLERTVALAPTGLPVVGIPEHTALIRDADGSWSSQGVTAPVVFLDGVQSEGLSALK